MQDVVKIALGAEGMESASPTIKDVMEIVIALILQMKMVAQVAKLENGNVGMGGVYP